MLFMTKKQFKKPVIMLTYDNINESINNIKITNKEKYNNNNNQAGHFQCIVLPFIWKDFPSMS